jgi:hypothetical protein
LIANRRPDNAKILQRAQIDPDYVLLRLQFTDYESKKYFLSNAHVNLGMASPYLSSGPPGTSVKNELF